MKLILLLAVMTLTLPGASIAQYLQQGKITFERKVNTYAQMEEFGNDPWVERFKSQIPKFKSTYFDLSFNQEKSYYRPGQKTDAEKTGYWTDGPANDNHVLTDLTAQQITANKVIYDKKFLVKDTMRKLEWKITDEIRTIANYKCHKAVSRICDSVYVVAFYTDDIMISSGPEMFGGLPGMIMELAIPRLHTTWTAITVDITAPASNEMQLPTKGKQVTEKELYETLKGSFSDWGKSANRNLWWSLL